jgi:predicted ester cyclase
MRRAESTNIEESKALICRWFEEVWNNGREELIDQMRAPDTRATGLGEGTQESQGAEPFRAFYANLRGTFPDLHVTIEDIVAEGDRVCVRLSLEGTHMGDALAPATGRKVKFAGLVMARVAGGRIAEAWNNLDQLGMLKQIGALPAAPGPDRFLTRQR